MALDPILLRATALFFVVLVLSEPLPTTASTRGSVRSVAVLRNGADQSDYHYMLHPYLEVLIENQANFCLHMGA